MGENFGPFLDNQYFNIRFYFVTSEKEIIGRFWIFASALLEPYKTNAKDGMISALKDSILFDGSRVCQPGKTQRLVVAVLQGRLEGINVDEFGEQFRLTTAQAMQMFFNVPANQQIQEWQPLSDAAERFCEENAAVNRGDFLAQIRLYAQNEGMALPQEN